MLKLNALDRAIGFFDPERAYSRGLFRAAIGSASAYAGAASGKRKTGFGPKGASANSTLGGAFSTLRDRARHMVRNNGNAHAIVDVTVRHLIGTGITPLWNTGSARVDGQIGLLWEEQVARSDIEGELHYYAQQELAVRSMIEGGDAALRFLDQRFAFDRRTPMRLQLMEGDQVDAGRTGTYDGRNVRLGVALGEWGRRLGYYVYPEHPGEASISSSGSSRFVPAADMRLLYRPERIGQVRGVTWLAPILLAAHDLAELMQNTIVKTRVEAAFAGFITNGMGLPTPLPVTESKQDGARQYLPEPGALAELKAGQDIKFAEPKTATQFEAVATATLRTMAIGAGLTYDQVTGDLRQANYTSLRMGRIEHRRFIEQVQFNQIIPRLCEPVAQRFIDRCILAGSLRPRAEGYRHSWVPPATEPVDPKRELDADIAAVRAGRMSPQTFVALWGYDWKTVIADTEAYWRAVDKAKLTFDIDPRKPLSGQGAPAVGKPGDGKKPGEDIDDDEPKTEGEDE